LGCILGDFFTTPSGHPARKQWIDERTLFMRSVRQITWVWDWLQNVSIGAPSPIRLANGKPEWYLPEIKTYIKPKRMARDTVVRFILNS
jgi:hypothetical protein